MLRNTLMLSFLPLNTQLLEKNSPLSTPMTRNALPHMVPTPSQLSFSSESLMKALSPSQATGTLLPLLIGLLPHQFLLLLISQKNTSNPSSDKERTLFSSSETKKMLILTSPRSSAKLLTNSRVTSSSLSLELKMVSNKDSLNSLVLTIPNFPLLLFSTLVKT
jgi:hypothetical protein